MNMFDFMFPEHHIFYDKNTAQLGMKVLEQI